VLHIVRTVVDALTTVSIAISLVTYYLSANKQWQVKHERAVAASISITSNGLYLMTTALLALNMALTSAPWQTEAETAFSLVYTAFMTAIGLSVWVPGERSKSLWRRVRESLRSERMHLGALAKALTQPSGARAILDTLARVAAVDGVVDDREKAFIKVFADSWGIDVDWDEVARTAAGSAKQRYAQLRRDIEGFLDTEPPPAQALQLADILIRLINADDKITDQEALIGAELGARLEQYAGERDAAVYEVHLVPRSPAQEELLATAYARLPRKLLPGGPVAVAATCYSQEYAEMVRRQYRSVNVYTAVRKVDPDEDSDAGTPLSERIAVRG
jgi:hypothetical protein